MNYVIGDIHDDNRRFTEMLKKINFSEEDHLFLLGDLFDRNLYDPELVGVYFNILKPGDRCTVIRGNHDIFRAFYRGRYAEFGKEDYGVAFADMCRGKRGEIFAGARLYFHAA